MIREEEEARSRSPIRYVWKTEEDPDVAPPAPLRFLPKRTPGVQPPLCIGTPTPLEMSCNCYNVTFTFMFFLLH